MVCGLPGQTVWIHYLLNGQAEHREAMAIWLFSWFHVTILSSPLSTFIWFGGKYKTYIIVHRLVAGNNIVCVCECSVAGFCASKHPYILLWWLGCIPQVLVRLVDSEQASWVKSLSCLASGRNRGCYHPSRRQHRFFFWRTKIPDILVLRVFVWDSSRGPYS